MPNGRGPGAIRRGVGSGVEYLLGQGKIKREEQTEYRKELRSAYIKKLFEKPAEWKPTTMQEALAFEMMKTGQYSMPEIQKLLTPSAPTLSPALQLPGREEMMPVGGVGLRGRAMPEEIPVVSPTRRPWYLPPTREEWGGAIEEVKERGRRMFRRPEPSIVEPVRKAPAKVAPEKTGLRQRAIKALEDAGYPATEANIKSAIQQLSR